jgi:peptide chain release factor 1
MLSMKSRTSLPSSSRKYSAAVSAVRPTRARARRLVHLAEHQRRLVEHRLAVRRLRLGHLVPEVVALAGALAHAAEHRVAGVLLGDVGDQLQDDDGLADAGASEQTHLAALRIGRDQVHDLDARLEGLDGGRLVHELRRLAVDRHGGGGVDRAALVHRLADHVHDATQGGLADRDTDHVAGVVHRLAAHQTVGGVHGDGPHGVLAQVLRHLEHQVALALVDAGVRHPQRRVDLGKPAGRELDVHHGAHHLNNLAVHASLSSRSGVWSPASGASRRSADSPIPTTFGSASLRADPAGRPATAPRRR